MQQAPKTTVQFLKPSPFDGSETPLVQVVMEKWVDVRSKKAQSSVEHRDVMFFHRVNQKLVAENTGEQWNFLSMYCIVSCVHIHLDI